MIILKKPANVNTYFQKREKKTYIKICLKIEESLLKYLKIMYNLKKNRGCSSKLFVIHPKEKITSKINLAGVLRQWLA